MSTVTRPMSLGQGKRLAAICVDMLPVNQISEIRAKALTSGHLKAHLEKFWNGRVMAELAPRHIFLSVVPTTDLSCLNGVVNNVPDFKQEEFYFPKGFEAKPVSPVILPINYSSSISELYDDIRRDGYRTAAPEVALGFLKAVRRDILMMQKISKIIILTDDRFSSDLMVIECNYEIDQIKVRREERRREDLFSGKYSVLVVEEETK